MSIYSISLKNYKSIRELKDFKFNKLNILIGANGSGKSNLISFFRLLHNLVNQNLQPYVLKSGRANSFLHFGQKVSSFLSGKIEFVNNKDFLANCYEFSLLPTQEGSLFIQTEDSKYNKGTNQNPSWDSWLFNSGSLESKLFESNLYRNHYLSIFFKNLQLFHFHDTSSTAFVKAYCNINDNEYLKQDASNLASFLFRLKIDFPNHFNMIERTIQSVAPFFSRFDLRPAQENKSEINLAWTEKGSNDYFDAHYLSDGTLRFMCLTTLLLQPEPPETIIIDEPELGLHPFAIEKLAAMIHSASSRTQIIVSTQSINLVDQFVPEDVIVVERGDNQTIFSRLKSDDLSHWLEDYSLGQLWDKNVLGGRPR